MPKHERLSGPAYKLKHSGSARHSEEAAHDSRKPLGRVKQLLAAEPFGDAGVFLQLVHAYTVLHGSSCEAQQSFEAPADIAASVRGPCHGSVFGSSASVPSHASVLIAAEGQALTPCQLECQRRGRCSCSLVARAYRHPLRRHVERQHHP